MRMNWKRLAVILALLLSICLSMGACLATETIPSDASEGQTQKPNATVETPAQGTEPTTPYAVLNDNVPTFTADEITTQAYETYGELDSLGRCTYAMACIGKELMPTEERGSISSVKPTGWHSVTYDCVSGGDLYNRCHLIAFQLTGENANRENLVTGTTYMNHEGMLPFENMVADYIKETGNHVMYRVIPDFKENDLVCSGVFIEAYSVEDSGEGICFYVYCYNVQPGIVIDYATGASRLADAAETTAATVDNATYVINTSSKKIHLLTCKYAKTMTSNMKYTTLSKADLEAQGYTGCGTCNP